MSLYQFDCGHILSISHTGELPDDMPCPSCERKQREDELIQEKGSETIAKWQKQGEWCRKQRQAAFRELRGITLKGLDSVLGCTKGDICKMERGEADPKRLKRFWQAFGKP